MAGQWIMIKTTIVTKWVAPQLIMYPTDSKNKEDSVTEAKYNRQEEPLVISKSVMDLFLKQTHPSDVISLYCFYYYTAKWQATNQPKATTSYVAKGLKWSEDRVRRIKKILNEIRLIEDLTSRDESGKINGHYILVKFIWSQESIKSHKSHKNIKNHTVGKPECGKP